MRTSFITLFALVQFVQLFCCQNSCAQEAREEKLWYRDIDGNTVREKKAVILEQIVQLNDSIWEVNLYRIGGPLILSAWSSDPEGRNLNGRYVTYDLTGFVDTVGAYFNGKRDGEWTIYGLGGRVQLGQVLFKEGQLIGTRDSVELKRAADSLGDVYKRDSMMAADHIFTKVETESAFPGGKSEWIHYIGKTLRYPEYDVEKHIMGTVVVDFIVDAEGHILPFSLRLDHSVEYHLDQEALHAIAVSPNWIPAMQQGRRVKSWQKQPFEFRMEVRKSFRTY